MRLHDVATPQNTTPGLFSIQGRRGCARNQTTDDLASSSATRSLLRHGEKGWPLLAFAVLVAHSPCCCIHHARPPGCTPNDQNTHLQDASGTPSTAQLSRTELSGDGEAPEKLDCSCVCVGWLRVRGRRARPPSSTGVWVVCPSIIPHLFFGIHSAGWD